jgi:hypothetical protein|tara:strand:- start:16153 stop:20880 length:4728 start_codon:yes stop_codon:yes gene_type:complete
MAIDKLIPQYLTSDTDQKLIKTVEMTDNLNIRVSNDDEGTAGVVKNIKGNTVVASRSSADNYPSGDNRVIGSVANEKNKEILFLLWNSNDDHGIYRLDMTTGKYQKLYQDSVLNFQKFSHAACSVVINEDEETLFYWTDNVNAPKKVNVNRLISGGYPSSLTSGTDEEKLLCLTVAKQRPLSPPSYSLVNNSSLGRNDIREKHFQFAYRYKYLDGEVSALSEWSSFGFASTQTKSDFLTIDKLDFFNQINVFVKNSVADVEKITVFARELNSETFFEIEELDNNGTTGSSTINFTNRKLGSPLSLDEVNKSYDNVPQVAKAQTVTGNRLMYGNYTEGYENHLPETDSNPIYKTKENTYTIKAYVEDGGNPYYDQIEADSSTNYQIKLDYSNLPSTVPANSFIHIEFVWVAEEVTVNAEQNANHNRLFFDFKTDKDLLSNKLLDNMVFSTGTRDTGSGGEPSWKLPIKNTIFKEVYRNNASKTKSQLIADINNRLSSKVFHGVIDGDRAIEKSGNVYAETSILLFATAEAKVWLEGTASFSLQQGNLVGDVKTFNLKFNGATVSVKAAEIIDFDYLPTSLTSYPVAVEVTSSPRAKIGGQSGFNLMTGAPLTEMVEYKLSGISGSSSYVAESLDGYRSFKSNANHSFGIVYTDDRGRTGGVNEIEPVFVEPTSDRTKKGGVEIDFRIKTDAPSWAKKWQIVYAGNTDIGNFVQYTIGNSLLPKDKDEFVSRNIYVSLNTLEGTNNSYREGAGANLEYKYAEGDRVRVLRYTDDSGNYVYPADKDFKVLSYEKLSEETDKFLAPAGFNYQAKNGYVLKIEANNEVGFDFRSVQGGDSLWDKEVVVEIYTPKKEIEDKVYSGVGKCYDVVNSKHHGDRTIESSASATITIDGSGGATSSDRLYIGDQISVSGVVITITSIQVNTDGTFSYEYSGTVSSQSAATYNIINHADANITVTTGDVFFRARRLVTRDNTIKNNVLLSLNWDESSFSSVVDFIEDYAISDFYMSRNFTKNKPYAFIPNSKTIRRRSSITYSDAYVIDSDRLNLSSFNLSLANWQDIDLIYGSISSLVSRGDALTVLQESKASQLPVGKNIIEFSSGNANVTASKNVLGNPSYYAGDYGTSNPESVVERFGVVYFADSEAGKVIRLSADGITPISEKGMDSFFEDKFKNLISATDKPRVVGGFDPDNNEYLITVEAIKKAVVTIGSTEYNIPVDASGSFTVQGYVYTPNTVLWNVWGNLWNTFCGNWEDIGNGIVILDNIYGTQSVLIDDELSGSTGTINVLVTDSTYSFSIIATLNLGTGVITLPSTTCEGTSITTGSSSSAEAGFTISYKHREGVWGSKYSFKPTMYVNINNELYSFFDTSSGVMWKHNVNATRNNFYGTQYNSEIEVVSNRNPSMVKVFEALAVEGGGTWSAALNTATQQTTIGTTDFDEREGHRYAMIPRDTSVSTSHKIYVGKVATGGVSADKVTFTTPINRIPFVVGDELKTASGANLVATSEIINGITDRKTIQCTNTITGIGNGDNVFVEHTARVDGDPMRDVFLKVKLTCTDTSAFEVHAVSLSYDRSRLHNDRVN